MARPKGLHLNTPAFDFVCGVRMTSKSAVAAGVRKNLSFISDLTAGRYGASTDTAKAISDLLMVEPSVLFPELVGFVPPDRSAAA
jgi:hypothetical protein